MKQCKAKQGSLWRKKLKFAALACVLIVALGELIARYGIGLGNPPLVVSHPTIEYMFLPNQDTFRFHNRQFYNRFGMRSENISDEKESGELRVLAIGDSVVNGGSLTDQDALATSIVKRKLESDSKFNRVTVTNISAGSWGPGNQLAYLEEYGTFNADMIVLVVSSHDYADVPTFQPLDPRTHPSAAALSALYEGFNRYLLPRIPWPKRSAQSAPSLNSNA